jgi:hypothetical protein
MVTARLDRRLLLDEFPADPLGFLEQFPGTIPLLMNPMQLGSGMKGDRAI